MEPKYFSNEKSSHYELADEFNYQIEMQFCDLGKGKSILTHDTLGTNALSISIPEGFQVNAYRDMRIFDIQTSSLSRRQESAIVRFGQAEKDSVYNVDLGILVKRGSFKPFLFGIFTLIAALGLLFGQLAMKKPEELQSPSIPNIVFAVLSVLCIGSAAAYLYQFFNKK